MARNMPDGGKDAALAWYVDADDYRFCTAEPTTAAEVASLAVNGALTPTFGSAADYAGGRQRQVDAKSGITATANGTINHCAMRKTGDSTLRNVNTVTPQAVLSGQTFNAPAWNLKVADAA